MRKGDFFLLLYSIWMYLFKEESVHKSFEATEIHSMNAEVILNCYNTTTFGSGED
jgi:hypothetical protein